ncbi:MAG: GrpB family protein [bacterium]|nr:GrpB family protein [bacterium]
MAMGASLDGVRNIDPDCETQSAVPVDGDDGLGLRYGTVRLEPSHLKWVSIAAVVGARVAQALGSDAVVIEHVGSTAVPGLLAKPVIDVAVGVRPDADLAAIRQRLESSGWVYRGDAGRAGGHVFVLERGPHSRIAHVHVVEYDGEQWRRYLTLRDLLQNDLEARSAYEQAKLALVKTYGSDNSKRAYTSGKTSIIEELLDGSSNASQPDEGP